MGVIVDLAAANTQPSCCEKGCLDVFQMSGYDIDRLQEFKVLMDIEPSPAVKGFANANKRRRL